MKLDISKIQCPDDHEELSLPYNIGSERKMYSKREDPKGLYLKLFSHKETRDISGYVIFGPLTEGPPGHAHGGVTAYVMDETMGTTAWNHGHRVVAEDIQIFFRQMTPQNQELQVKAWVESVDEKRVVVKGQILNAEGTVLSEAVGNFHILSEEQLKGLNVSS